MSHSVCLKDIPMEKEPEPEPIVLPSVPLVPSGTVAKKLVNLSTHWSRPRVPNEIAKSSAREARHGKARGAFLAERPGDPLSLLCPCTQGCSTWSGPTCSTTCPRGWSFRSRAWQ